MNKTLSVALLVFAGATGAIAASNIDDGISGYNYTTSTSLTSAQLDRRGTNSLSGVSNYGWNECTIDLGKNAHYEIKFRIGAYTNNDQADPMFNIYLAGSKQSILYGNYVDVHHNGTYWLDGYAGIFRCEKNVAGLDCQDGQTGSCIPNYAIQNRPGVSGTATTRIGGPDYLSNSQLVTGYHLYTIDIETFADASQKDIIKFKYNGANTNNSEKWTDDFKLQDLFSGIGASEKLSIGTFFSDNGGDIGLYNNASVTGLYQTLIVQDRTEPPPPVTPPAPTPEPEPEPSVPEPSAFGLLAGLGAIALAASRRRRSR